MKIIKVFLFIVMFIGVFVLTYGIEQVLLYLQKEIQIEESQYESDKSYREQYEKRRWKEIRSLITRDTTLKCSFKTNEGYVVILKLNFYNVNTTHEHKQVINNSIFIINNHIKQHTVAEIINKGDLVKEFSLFLENIRVNLLLHNNIDFSVVFIQKK